MSIQPSFTPDAAGQTQQQIRQAVTEISELSGADVSPQQFYDGFLTRVVTALSASGGAVWTCAGGEPPSLISQLNLAGSGLLEDADARRQHDQLIQQAFHFGEGTLVPPRARTSDENEWNNPTPFLLVLGPLKLEGRTHAVVEIFQRAAVGHAIERGHLRFVVQMCSVAAAFLKTCEFKRLQQRDALWLRLQQFNRAVQQSLDVRETAYTLANEACRLIECDRVSVAVCHGRRVVIEAVSGQDLVESRANVVGLMSRLAQRVIATGEPLWYTGSDENLPPQIEEALHAYVDESHSRTVGVVPLVQPQQIELDEEQPPKSKILGALIVERIDVGGLDDSGLGDGLCERTEVAVEQGTLALANALTHERVFLMPVWRTVAKSRWLVEARRLPKTVAVTGVVLAVLLALAIIPADFRITAHGTLQPAERRDVFVQETGVVSDVLVDHGQQVERGAELVRLRSRDLEVAITELSGRRSSSREQMLTLQRSRGEARLSFDERNRLSGQYEQLQMTVDSLSEQLELLKAKRDLLSLRSPIAGQVVTWDLKNRLRDRPVDKGQLMLSVANPNGAWELELLVSEDHAGFVAAANSNRKTDAPPLTVSYILATDSATPRTGQVVEIHSSAEVRGEDGNTVLIRATIDRDSIPAVNRRPGAAVTARIDCGRRSLGYVWFHDVLTFIRSKILFRL
ncbi:MAG: efflux RND transporter periplasmic adaptor subunit [Planctomycetia bacterium]|nr:efflux RND transporter periplasmic adaptor subunit [Planctomycetia bacterium]